MGIDQGRYGDPYLIQRWYLGDSPHKEEQWRHAHVEIVHWGLLNNLDSDIDDLVERWGIDLIGLDNEPGQSKFAVSSMNPNE